MFKKINSIKNDESGQSIVIIAIAMVVLLGFAAFAVDIGYASHQKSLLQNGADSAALAGAMSLHNSSDAVVKDKVAEYLALNLSEPPFIESIDIDRNVNTVQVNISQKTPEFFAGIFAGEARTIGVTAKAKTWAGEALPFINLDDIYELNQEITLWDWLKYGDDERLLSTISHDNTSCIVDYEDGVFFKGGVDSSVKKLIEYCEAQNKDIYVFSLVNEIISDPVALEDNVSNKEYFMDDMLVLLRVRITDIDLNGNNRGIRVLVKEIIPDFTYSIPEARAGGESKAILIN